jgi:hypothetical protein
VVYISPQHTDRTLPEAPVHLGREDVRENKGIPFSTTSGTTPPYFQGQSRRIGAEMDIWGWFKKNTQGIVQLMTVSGLRPVMWILTLILFPVDTESYWNVNRDLCADTFLALYLNLPIV